MTHAASIRLKNILLLLVFLILWLPMILNKFGFLEVRPLDGDITYPSEPVSNAETWFSGEYQEKQEAYINTAFGFRNFCIRTNNQIAYSLFNKAKANTVIVGKESYLYEKSYLDSYTGRDFVGMDSINTTIKKLQFISDTLNKLNKSLVVILAAGKASFFPEFIPEKYLKMEATSNYKQFSSGMQKANLNLIDFNDWFVANKNKSKYPLYPQYGIHWSRYGTTLVLDSIIKKIENLRNIKMQHVYYDSVVLKQPEGLDYDIASGMNLLFRLKSFDMASGKAKFTEDSAKTKPAVLTISDSFYWGMFDFGLSKVFKNDHFWFYNKMVYPESFTEELYSDYLDVGKEMQNHDVIILMATEANLKDIGWGFIENAYEHFTHAEPAHSEEYYKKLKQLVVYIKRDQKWLSEITERAKKDNVLLYSQIIKEAKFVLKNDGVY